jgi:hypothetical protein
MDDAKLAARRALELDPQLTEATILLQEMR